MKRLFLLLIIARMSCAAASACTGSVQTEVKAITPNSSTPGRMIFATLEARPACRNSRS